MHQNKTLKEKIRDGKNIYGTAIVSPSPHWPEALKDAGLDFVFLDTEHTPIDRMTLSAMCRYYASMNIAPFVRIPSPDPFEACKALDGGAAGIVAPYIETPEQVMELVGAVKYKPLKGERLRRALNGEKLEEKLQAYLEERNKDNLLILNIESVPAMQNLDAILEINGVDAVIVGPHDLSCSLGFPEEYRNPKFEEALRLIIKKVRMAGKAVGIHLSEDAQFQIKWAAEGLNLIIHSSDIALFSQRLKQDLETIKESLNNDHSTSVDKGIII